MPEKNLPLATRFRPQTLEEFIGQEHILGEGRLLRRILISGTIPPLIFSGPPGTGKTTLGFIIAQRAGAHLEYVNAAFTSVGEIKKILKNASHKAKEEGIRTLLFIDEIHRFNKLQQETLIPDTETASIGFIGATIYNPGYYLIRSLISRAVIARFKPLTEAEITHILKRAVTDPSRGLGAMDVEVTPEAFSYLAVQAAGDARKALNALELGIRTTRNENNKKIYIDLAVAEEIIQKNIFYDKNDSYHYDTISAFIKSVRGSDADSAVYWLAKMITSGEDLRFIGRRLVILASEDIGCANPFALVLTTSAYKAVEFVGEPEASLILAQATIYCATSPKSNASTRAIQKALEDVKNSEEIRVPSHLRTHAKNYKYPHNFYAGPAVGGYVAQEYGALKTYYTPLASGEERKIKAFCQHMARLKKQARAPKAKEKNA